VQSVPVTTYVVSSNPVHGVLDTTLRDKVCQQLAASQWFSPGTPVSFTNKTDRHHIAEVVLKVALNTKPKLIMITSWLIQIQVNF
jgi:hypothetical protein